MKLSFSIQNWKDLEWNEFCTTAAEVRLQGIELYNVKDPMFGRKDSPVNPELAAATRRNLIRQNLSIPCVDTAGDFTEPDFTGEFEEALRTAVNLGISNICLHTLCTDQEVCEKKIGDLLNKIEQEPVSLLVESSGAYADTGRLRDLLNRFADDQLAGCWNMYETCVNGKEDAETTITNLGAYVRHVHIHDYRMEEGRPVPELAGEGQLPLQELMDALRSVNYD